jgi:hypothetical protein
MLTAAAAEQFVLRLRDREQSTATTNRYTDAHIESPPGFRLDLLSVKSVSFPSFHSAEVACAEGSKAPEGTY